MRKFSEERALNILRDRGVGIEGRILFLPVTGLKGLTGCSAFDYLKSKGYKGI